MRKIITLLALALGLVLVAAPHGESQRGQGQRYQLRPDAVVSFQTFGPRVTEPASARFGTVNSRLLLDPADLSTARGGVQVFLHSVRSARSSWDAMFRAAPFLGLRQHPIARFTLQEVRGAEALRHEAFVDLELVGRFEVHGITKDITIPAQVECAAQDRINVVSDFVFRFADHGITIPTGSTESMTGVGARVHATLSYEPAAPAE